VSVIISIDTGSGAYSSVSNRRFVLDKRKVHSLVAFVTLGELEQWSISDESKKEKREREYVSIR
jgi:hypothetical protein